MRAILISLILGTALASAQDDARARFVFLAHSVMNGSVPDNPQPKPDAEECPNCGGTGKLGDGTVSVKCPVCDGTGKITQDVARSQGYGWPPRTMAIAAAEKPVRKHGVIEIWTSDDCPPCAAWKQDWPMLRDRGWVIVEHQNASGATPRAKIWVNGKSHETLGYKGWNWFTEKLKDALFLYSNNHLIESAHTPSPELVASRTIGAYQVVGSTAVSIPYDDPYTDYRPRWTWPGNLQSHLARSPHNINTATWTQDQREMYHDRWHDRNGPR